MKFAPFKLSRIAQASLPKQELYRLGASVLLYVAAAFTSSIAREADLDARMLMQLATTLNTTLLYCDTSSSVSQLTLRTTLKYPEAYPT